MGIGRFPSGLRNGSARVHVAWLPDPEVRPLDAGRPDVQAALSDLGRADLALRDGWTLHGLFRGQELVALGAHGASGRPGGVFEASIDMIGVRPAFRGQGLGRRLHAHLLGRAAERHDWHRGGTGADNHAMRRIFEHSGSVLLGTQRYFRQP
ncbi:GNAT family N-acetyltransferase [Deinococcus sp. KSM4-11]|nr:GNAT family N-acetyltransferase [Deinococcus sp. KSM4-11]